MNNTNSISKETAVLFAFVIIGILTMFSVPILTSILFVFLVAIIVFIAQKVIEKPPTPTPETSTPETPAKTETKSHAGTAIKVVATVAIAIIVIYVGLAGYNHFFSGDSSSKNSFKPSAIQIPYSKNIQIPFSDTRNTGIASNPENIIVPADYLWYNTGIWVEKGQKITFSATGQVSGSCIETDGGYKFVGPDGWSHNPSFNQKRQLLVNNAPFMSLVGGIGTEKKGFFIGSSRTITSKNNGIIYLAANDGAVDDDGNERPEWWICNPGSFTVKIEIQ